MTYCLGYRRLDKLKVLMDDTDFATSHPIVRYLIENGEVAGSPGGGSKAGGAGDRRGSIFRQLSRQTSAAIDLESQLDAGQLKQRQGSIITKDLIDNLKKNKKRIVAKGTFKIPFAFARDTFKHPRISFAFTGLESMS